MSYFDAVKPVEFAGSHRLHGTGLPPLQPQRTGRLGKRMEDHLRLAVCYWHTFVWPGSDVFGQGTFDRPWHAGQRRDDAGAAQGGRGIRAFHTSRRAVLHLP